MKYERGVVGEALEAVGTYFRDHLSHKDTAETCSSYTRPVLLRDHDGFIALFTDIRYSRVFEVVLRGEGDEADKRVQCTLFLEIF